MRAKKLKKGGGGGQWKKYSLALKTEHKNQSIPKHKI